MRVQELPDWVLQLVADLNYYEDVHPPLYTWEKERTPCPNSALTGVPIEVRDAVELLTTRGVIVPCEFRMKQR